MGDRAGIMRDGIRLGHPLLRRHSRRMQVVGHGGQVPEGEDDVDTDTGPARRMIMKKVQGLQGRTSTYTPLPLFTLTQKTQHTNAHPQPQPQPQPHPHARLVASTLPANKAEYHQACNGEYLRRCAAINWEVRQKRGCKV